MGLGRGRRPAAAGQGAFPGAVSSIYGARIGRWRDHWAAVGRWPAAVLP